MRRRPSRALGAGLAVLLAGCALPHEPVAVTPLTDAGLGLAAAPAPQIAADWWRMFGDPQLDRIVADAMAGSPSLEMAMARVRASQASLLSARGGRLPQIAIDANEQVQRLSGAYIIPPPYGGSVQSVGDAQVGLSWDLDFWGRQAAAIRAAAADADASRVDADAARLALAGAVVQTYLDFVRTGYQIALAREVVQAQDRLVGLMQVLRDSQLGDESAVRTAQSRAAMARQALLRAEAQETLLVHALALLAGRGADYYPQITASRLQLAAVPALPQTLPADLLARRPDIQSARLRIAAASAGRQVARRAFYPNVNLTGLVGVQALGIGKLFSGDAFTAGVGGAIHLPIFEGGRLRADYAGATANVDAAIADYNQTVLQAVQETADALSQLQRLTTDLREQRSATRALADVRGFSDVRARTGLGNQIEVVTAGLDLLSARQQLVELEAEQALVRVRLLVALGGGVDARAMPNSAAGGQPAAAATAAGDDDLTRNLP